MQRQESGRSKYQVISRYAKIGCGVSLLNLMYVLVSVPYGIINGGVTSLSMILSRLPLTGMLPVNVWVALVTGILLLLCLLFLGRDNFIASMFSAVVGVGAFNLFTLIVPDWIRQPIFRFGELGSNPILPLGTVILMAAAAAFVGIGYYLCISNNSTAVGMDTIAMILNKKNPKIPIAYAMYAINIIVLLLGLYTYGLICVLMGIAFAGIQAVTLNFFLRRREQEAKN